MAKIQLCASTRSGSYLKGFDCTHRWGRAGLYDTDLFFPSPDVIQDLGLPQTGGSVGGGDPLMGTTVQEPGESGRETAPQSEGCEDSTIQPQAFILSAGLAPVPSKLVAKIR